MASSEEDDVMDTAADLEDDLFGDDDEEPIERTRELSDDEERNDRAPRHEAEEIDDEGGREAQVQESTVWRHPVPKPVDGEVRSYFIKFRIMLT
jgi:RNA polymerase-associated protein LEO1